MVVQVKTRVDTDPTVGRVLIANIDFEVGEEVLREAPLFSWPIGDFSAFLKALCSADEETRDVVMSMFRPSLDSTAASVRKTGEEAQRILSGGGSAEWPEFCTVKFAHEAILIAKLNAHSFRGGLEAALFNKGCKAAHSCAPNAAYSSKNVPGMLVLKAIRPIAEGEQITFTYIADIWRTNTADRRLALSETKLFTCHCVRCDSPDVLRALPCPQIDEHIVVPQPSEEASDEAAILGVVKEQYVCNEDGCPGVTSQVDMAIVDVTREKASLAIQSATGRAFVDETMAEPVEIVEAIERLPRVNSGAIQGRKLLATLMRSRAGDSGDARLWLRAAKEEVAALSAMECVGAGCLGENCAVNVHSPVYHCAPDALEAARSLAKADGTDSCEVVAATVVRYLPLMHIMWPHMKNDDHMMQLLSRVQNMC